MSTLAMPLCFVLGHRRARRRVWNDGVDLRAPCVRCGTPLIRTADHGWRPFTPDDDRPDRIGRDAYREQIKREQALSGSSADRPEQWARHLVAAYGSATRPVDPTTLFDRLLTDLSADPAFVAATASGRLDLEARRAVGTASARLLGAEGLPDPVVDPLARYLHARAQIAAEGGPSPAFTDAAV